MAMQRRRAPHCKHAISNTEHFYINSTLHGTQSYELHNTVFLSSCNTTIRRCLDFHLCTRNKQRLSSPSCTHDSVPARRMKYPPHSLSSFFSGSEMCKASSPRITTSSLKKSWTAPQLPFLMFTSTIPPDAVVNHIMGVFNKLFCLSGVKVFLAHFGFGALAVNKPRIDNNDTQDCHVDTP